MKKMENPLEQYPTPPFEEQQQPIPGKENVMQPGADHGELTYRGSGKLIGRKAVIRWAAPTDGGRQQDTPGIGDRFYTYG